MVKLDRIVNDINRQKPLQCFETVGWVTSRTSSLWITCLQLSQKLHFGLNCSKFWKNDRLVNIKK